MWDDPAIRWESISSFMERQTRAMEREFNSSRPTPAAYRMGLKPDPPKRSLADLQDKPAKQLTSL